MQGEETFAVSSAYKTQTLHVMRPNGNTAITIFEVYEYEEKMICLFSSFYYIILCIFIIQVDKTVLVQTLIII